MKKKKKSLRNIGPKPHWHPNFGRKEHRSSSDQAPLNPAVFRGHLLGASWVPSQHKEMAGRPSHRGRLCAHLQVDLCLKMNHSVDTTEIQYQLNRGRAALSLDLALSSFLPPFFPLKQCTFTLFKHPQRWS